MSNPTSWEDVYHCDCEACAALKSMHERCVQLSEFLAVQDCRMFDQGFRVADVRKVFVEPAVEGPPFETVEAAADYVLARQRHCDAVVSSWPLRPHGRRDYRWMLQRVV
jgi:hypothetical protein